MALLNSGCPGQQTVQLFDPDGRSALAIVEPASITQLGSAQLGRVRGDVDSTLYTVAPTARIYLVRDDLNAGLDPITGSIPTLRMPSSTDVDASRSIATGPNTNWSSLRVHDLGRCSLFISWAALGTAFNSALIAQLVANGSFGSSVTMESTGGRQNVGPILRRIGTYEAADEIRYNGGFRAESVGGCQPTIVDFETRYFLSSSSPRPGVFNHALFSREARAEVRDFCIAESKIEDDEDPQLPLMDQVGELIFQRLGIDRDAAADFEQAHFGCEPDRIPGTSSTDLAPERVLVFAVVDPGSL